MPPSPLSLYIHWPFCLAKCPYCDFNSHVATGPVDHSNWLSSLLCEMKTLARRIPDAHLVSIFFGGGTPSLMRPQTAAALIAAAGQIWRIDPDIEVTLEANPTSAEKNKFQDFARGGVNRLSIGIQAFDNTALKRLGRRHDVAEALAALEMAKQIFPRVSFDLIYARQGQKLKDWESELKQALSLSAGHLSLYQLTVEPGTPFHEAECLGKLKIPGEDRARDLFDLTQQLCEQAGLPAYEISNHALPGQESRHNLNYWRCGDYLGIGPGAHSRINGRALANERDPVNWMSQVAENGHALVADTALSNLERAEEMLLMGLRLNEGLDLRALTARTGYHIAPDKIEAFGNDGLLQIKPATSKPATSSQHLSITPDGRPVLNALINALAMVLCKLPI